MKSISLLSICVALLPALKTHAQVNLLVNGGAEGGAPSTDGWNAVNSGSACYTGSGWRVAGTQNGFPDAEEGGYIFYPGCGGSGEGETYELNQDVNVGMYAAAIDANSFQVTFSGYTQSYDQSTPDATDIIVEYRDAANTTVLDSYNTGVATNLDAWVNYTDTRNAPEGTRYIRIRLIGTSHNGSSIDSYFDNLSLTSPSVLAVHFVSFTATLMNDAVVLNWKTSGEQNTKGYDVQLSPDGRTWSSVGFVNAKGSAAGNTGYSFTANRVAPGTTYYRLKQVGDDNEISYSEIRAISFDGRQEIKIYPNPTSGVIFIKSPGMLRMEVTDLQGKIIMKSAEVTAGPVDLSNLRKGVYLLKLISEEDTIVEKIEKN